MPRGQVLIVIALAMVGLIGMLGLVIDGGSVFLDRRNAQNAADSAALASAMIRIRGGEDWVAAALRSAAENGYNNDPLTNTVQVYSPPKDGPHAGKLEYLQVIIISHVNATFARVFGWVQFTNVVEAVARTKLPEIGPLMNGNAVVSLAPTNSCFKRPGLWVHGEATLDITGGGVFVNSNNPTCAVVEQGSGSIRIRDDHQISIVGGAYIQKPQLLTPGVTTGAIPVSFPPPFYMPRAGCGSKIATVSEDGTSMSPGNWEEEFPPEGVTHLSAGIYCLNHGFHVKGLLRGKNVLFVVEEGEFRISSGATVKLDAPSAGPNSGLLVYVPLDNHNKVVLNGTPETTIQGTILAPASPIIINGNDSASGFHSQIIGYTVEADGNSNVVIKYIEEQNYVTLSMPEVQLAE